MFFAPPGTASPVSSPSSSSTASTPSPLLPPRPDSEKGSHDLYWTTKNLRSTYIIGYEGERSIAYRLDTPEAYATHSRTVVSSGDFSPIAYLDWVGIQLGTVTVGPNTFPMSHLVGCGSTPKARSFWVKREQRCFEWRQDDTDPGVFMLFEMPRNMLLARFECGPFNQAYTTPEIHGCMQYWFSNHDELLLMSILSLTITRWLLKYGT